MATTTTAKRPSRTAATAAKPEKPAPETLPATRAAQLNGGAPSATDNALRAIFKAASDPATDVEKMRELFDLYERMQNRANEVAFIQAMHAAQAEMEPVAKKGRNESTKSNYARLEDIAKAIQPIITRHGFSPSFTTEESTLAGHYRIVLMLSHIDGFTRRYAHDVPIDGVGMKGSMNKTATHAYGSTLAYGERYALVGAFNIPTSSDDDGNRGVSAPPPSPGDAAITAVQLRNLRGRIADPGYKLTEPELCKHLRVERLEELTQAGFDDAIRRMTARYKHVTGEAPK